MCGICGVYNFSGKPVDEQVLLRMRDIMKHRGPNDAGIYIDKYLGLGNRRLSIIDLSKTGHQPMLNEDNTICISYNGEIYNYLSLRNNLIKKGYTFRSKTDTEVILHGFEEYGPEIVMQLNGMFAFSIWNSKTRELYLFRDRLGIKPLYYYSDNNCFLFGSEIKAILEAGVSAELEHSVLSSYLSLRYTPGEQTMFQKIKKLPPGTYVKISHNGMEEIRTYWDLLDQNNILPYSEKEAQDVFFDLLNDSVRSRLIADVPVGAFLSGGIDSATVSALMKKHQNEVETFTFGFGLDIDETDKARRISDYIGANNNVQYLNKESFKYYPKTLWHIEEPFGHSIIVPTYLLAKSAAQKVSVLLLGDGADEILGGYVHQLAMTYGHLINKAVPMTALLSFTKVMKHLPQRAWDIGFPYPEQMGKSGVDKVLDYVRNIDSPGRAYMSLCSVFTEDEKQNLIEPDFYQDYIKDNSPAHLYSHYLNCSDNSDFLNRLLQLDLKYWNVDLNLLRVDKLTMAHSIEARVPFLDHRLVELCLRLPRKFKMKNFNVKVLMRNAVKKNKLLPDKVMRAKKKPFYMPLEKAYDKRFFDFARDVLSEDNIKRRGIFNMKFVSNILDNPKRELLHSQQLMTLLNFEIWAQLFLDNQWREY